MADIAAPLPRDMEALIGRIRRRRQREESETFVAGEMRLMAESMKPDHQARKLERDRMLAPWHIAPSGMLAGTALVVAGAALIKLIGS